MKNKYSPYILMLVIVLSFHVMMTTFVIRYTPSQLVAIDDWVHNTPIAIAAANHQLSWQDVFRPMNKIHLSVPTNLTTIALVHLNDWDIQQSLIVNYVLATLNWALLMLILTRHDPSLRLWLILPITAFIFTPQQYYNWIIGLHTGRLYPVTFLLLALCFGGYRIRSWTIALAGLMAVMSAISLFSGVLTLIVLWVAMPLWGYRKWQHYGIALVAVALAGLMYMIAPDINFSNAALLQEGENFVQRIALMDYVWFASIYWGGIYGVGPNNSNLLLLMMMGMGGLAIFLWNLWFIWKHDDYRQHIVAPVALTLFALGESGLSAIARVDTFGVRWGAANHYTSVSVLLWVAIAVLMVITMRHLIQHQTYNAHPRLFFTNGLFALLMMIFLTSAIIGGWQFAEHDHARLETMSTCISELADGTRTARCDVVGGVVTSDMVQALQAEHLAGFKLDTP